MHMHGFGKSGSFILWKRMGSYARGDWLCRLRWRQTLTLRTLTLRLGSVLLMLPPYGPEMPCILPCASA